MKRKIGFFLIVAGLTASVAQAQFGVPWHHTPEIVGIGAEGDSRLGLVDEAVAYWNKVLKETGSGFRLGPVTRVVQPVPEEALQALSRAVLMGPPGGDEIPQALRDLPGDLTILLGESAFVSFAGPFFADNSKRVVGIRGKDFEPLSLPNVARNVITHELGQAIGLGHNSDPATLMCGRPAPCRHVLFRSDEPKVFPLTDEERRRLSEMYPPEWKPRSPR